MSASTNSQQKVCVVMRQATLGTHMDYVYEMARSLREEAGVPLTLLLEKPTAEHVWPAWVQTQRYNVPLLRVLENVYRLFHLRRSGHTVFYVHYSFVSVISAGLVTKLCGGTVYYWNCGMPWLFKRGLFARWFEWLAFQSFDYLVTGADALVPDYMHTYGLTREQIKVIPNWIDLQSVTRDPAIRKRVRTQLKISETAPVLLFVHKLVERKGARYLPTILKNAPVGTQLVIAGDGEERTALEAEFNTLGLLDRVHFLGYVDRGEVNDVLQAADVFVMPSEEEGCPHALIEAMAYQLPFVSFAVGGVRDMVGPDLAAYVYEVGDTVAMNQGIQKLLTDTNAYHEVKTASKVAVASFDKPNVLHRFKALLTG